MSTDLFDLTEQEQADLDRALAAMAAGQFDFVDAGTSKGGSLVLCQKRFQCGPGIGFDSDPEKIALARKAGHHVYRCDLLETPLPENSVSFGSMLDFLEHLPDEAMAKQFLVNIARASRDFLVVRHPSFEDIEYLADFDLKIGWTHWSGHKNMMTVADFERVFADLGWTEYAIKPRRQILSSEDPAVVPIHAPINAVHYNDEVHGPKNSVAFDRPVYTGFDIFVALRPFEPREWRKLTAKLL
ncbi:MAG: methyltransferase domain-containing protein [Opitutales bacterium]